MNCDMARRVINEAEIRPWIYSFSRKIQRKKEENIYVYTRCTRYACLVHEIDTSLGTELEHIDYAFASISWLPLFGL